MGMQYSKNGNRCLLISVGLLAVFTFICSVVIVAFAVVRCFPWTPGKQICTTYIAVVSIFDLLSTF